MFDMTPFDKRQMLKILKKQKENLDCLIYEKWKWFLEKKTMVKMYESDYDSDCDLSG